MVNEELATNIFSNTHVNVLIQPMHKCNLRCVYCYARSWRTKYSSPMSKETLERSLALYVEYIENTIEEETIKGTFKLILHGFEPLQYGHENIEYILSYLKRESRKISHYIDVVIQTNGTLIDEDYVDMFRRYDAQVSISIDGPKYIHNKLRCGTYDKVIDALMLIKKYNLRFGVVSVITSLHIDNEYQYYKWIKQYDINSVLATPLILIRDSPYIAPYSANPSDLLSFYLKIYNIWKKDIYRLDLKPITTLIRLAITGNSNICTLGATCYQWITIDPNGDVGLCSGEPIKLGNIKNYKSLKDLLIKNYKLWLMSLIRLERLRKTKCGMCKFFDYCKGGCMLSALEFTGSLYNPDPVACKLYMPLFNIIYEDVKNLIESNSTEINTSR